MNRKKNGVYYTPAELADYLVQPLIKVDGQTILDPSYGEGSLLLAAERYASAAKIKALHLHGCDIQPVNGLLKHLPAANLTEVDFFDYESENAFHTVLMNPPYVRHHIQETAKIANYRRKFSGLQILNNKADLWAYFLIKATTHLEKSGSIGAILPWSFLQADYANPLRTWLYSVFGEIRVATLTNKYFKDAEERVVVLWLKEFGQKCSSLKISSSKAIESEIEFEALSFENWTSNKVHYSSSNEVESLLTCFKSKYGFVQLREVADVKIGIVTGAVSYFTITKKEATELGFKRNHLIPILSSAKEFVEYLKGEETKKVLLKLNSKNEEQYQGYLQKGIIDKIHLTLHSKLRSPWFNVKIGDIPDAFFHYRVTKIPFLVPNWKRIQSTNSIHRVYFKNLNTLEQKWLFVSILSAPCQLSIETNAKIYGRGILKIEPNSLKNTLVLIRKDPSVEIVYDEIMQLLAHGDKGEAVTAASKFIYKELNFDRKLIKRVEFALLTIRELRLI